MCKKNVNILEKRENMNILEKRENMHIIERLRRVLHHNYQFCMRPTIPRQVGQIPQHQISIQCI